MWPYNVVLVAYPHERRIKRSPHIIEQLLGKCYTLIYIFMHELIYVYVYLYYPLPYSDDDGCIYYTTTVCTLYLYIQRKDFVTFPQDWRTSAVVERVVFRIVTLKLLNDKLIIVSYVSCLAPMSFGSISLNHLFFFYFYFYWLFKGSDVLFWWRQLQYHLARLVSLLKKKKRISHCRLWCNWNVRQVPGSHFSYSVRIWPVMNPAVLFPRSFRV